MDNRKRSNAVGFGNPPKDSQFRKGLSGNPKGRPKGHRNLATVLGQTLREKVVINENGTRKTVTKLDAAVKQLVNKAAGGDLPAMRLLSALVGSAESASAPAKNETSMADADHKIMNRLLDKLKQSHSVEDTGDEN